MKKIIIRKRSSLICLFFILSCSNPKIYFDIDKQEIIECGNYRLSNIYIENDSVNEKNIPIESQINIKWDDKDKAPYTISLRQIPESYKIYRDNERIAKFALMKNTSYTISHAVIGKEIFSIRVWTDSNGIVYKTTYVDCNE